MGTFCYGLPYGLLSQCFSYLIANILSLWTTLCHTLWLLRVCLVGEKVWILYCSIFRCYLTNNIQLWTLGLKDSSHANQLDYIISFLTAFNTSCMCLKI